MVVDCTPAPKNATGFYPRGLKTMATIATRSQPSYYYLLIARTCVVRSRRTTPAHAQALREAANHYLAKSRADRASTGLPRSGR
jgi:hypothetical protein